MTAQASSPRAEVDIAKLWTAAAAHRAQVSGLAPHRPARSAELPPAEPLAVPKLASLTLTAVAAAEPSSSDELMPDLESLYVGAEGPSDAITEDGNDIRLMTAAKGDTLASMLRDAGARPEDIRAALKAIGPGFNPKGLRRGQRVTVELKPEPPRPLRIDPDAEIEAAEALAKAEASVDIANTRELVALTIQPSVERDVTVRRDGSGDFILNELQRELAPRDYRATGTITTSLFFATEAAGVPKAIANELLQLFAYDVDFQRDVKDGDSFELFYTRYYDNMGDPVKDGEVLYAALNLSGETRALYRFKSPVDGAIDYYHPDGASARKFLLRTPVEGARISSGYGMRRHPLLRGNFNRMHKGIDFAAPTGTPIMAAGNGSIDYIGPKGTYGNFIRIRHNTEYQTAYAHLSKFAQGLRVGSKIRQGQIIGYVGNTGRSTGPHLHYEILIKGVHVDPARVKTGNTQRLQGLELVQFEAEKARIDSLMSSSPFNGPVASVYLAPGSAAMVQ